LLEKFTFKATSFSSLTEYYKSSKSGYGVKPFEIKYVWNGFKLKRPCHTFCMKRLYKHGTTNCRHVYSYFLFKTIYNVRKIHFNLHEMRFNIRENAL